MPTKARGLRVREDLDRQISEEAHSRGTSWSVVTNELLEEAMRMRRSPGVVFVDGPTGRRPVVAGTGIDVWELVATWHACERDYEQFRQNYDWLTEPQLRAALAYYELYPEEIDARLAREESWTPQRVRRDFPFTAPRAPHADDA